MGTRRSRAICRGGIGVVASLFIPAPASASWFTHLRDAVTAPVRVPVQAAVNVVHKPTLKNFGGLVISPGKAVKETADNLLQAADDAVDDHPGVKKVLDKTQPSISVTVAGGGGGGGAGGGGTPPSGGGPVPPGGPVSTPGTGPTPGSTITTTVSPGGGNVTIAAGSGSTSVPPATGGPKTGSAPPPQPSASDALDDGGYDQAVEPVRNPASQLSPAAEKLKEAADSGYAAHPHACNESVIHALDLLGNHDLDGKKANDQVAFLDSNWKEISPQAAKALAESGGVAVAGLQDMRIDPKTNTPHSGHVMLVVPGPGRTVVDPATHVQTFYPNVEAGAEDPRGSSDGSRTAADTWAVKRRASVKYYTPKAAR